MAIEQSAEKSFLDATLYCEEEKWADVDEDDDDTLSLSPLLLLEQDLFWEDEELQSLFSKEKQTRPISNHSLSLSPSRKESVHWILKINAHYSFSPLTAILAVNYLDRFLSSLAEDKPWMMHLAALTCLSLAAKLEETHVPLLLDLQVEETKYVFEPKTVQRMELLVLSALEWRMNPVTPVSFLDHIIRRLGLKSHHVHWEFLTPCQNLLLSVSSDPRFTLYLPSVLATATMLHVIHRLEPRRAVEYETQLLGVLKINKEEVDECYEVIQEVLDSISNNGYNNGLKRKICQVPLPGSPDAAILNSDCKKARVHQIRLPSLITHSPSPSLNI
ncbi:cyclin-D3-1-like isoform X1 [Salvia splendens]|nr:cyclin-D3-1-like isoform X1 [Salvia splendens]